jgi:hypothetical protein
MLHPSRQVRLGSLNKSVDMIGHPTIGQDDPAASLNLILKSLGESFVMSGVVKQRPSSITACDDVVVRASELDPRWPRHVTARQENTRNRRSKHKSAEHSTQGLTPAKRFPDLDNVAAT